ncbi:radical SAM protein [Oscillospiraceae bacterium OttesenSCG-928-G22]|nr:radical SAM protein [Oscillospiraceae bacterium OttesenSCG-928-G22]
MKLSAYHKGRCDAVTWWNPMSDPACDVVYSSKVFDFTPENTYLPENTIRGGTGYGLYTELPPEVDGCYPDYTLYPDCDYAIGYITRGCPNKCRWCVVPQKEGDIRSYADWRDIVRPDSNKLVLMDNNILSSEYGITQLAELSQTDYRIDLNQGMDARLVDERTASIIAGVKWIRFIRFSCDQKAQVDAILNAVALLAQHGIKPYRIFVYLLVTADIADAAYRVERLKPLKNINLYAQAERNERQGITPNAAQLEFAQRYIYGRCYKKESWPEYCTRNGFSGSQ